MKKDWMQDSLLSPGILMFPGTSEKNGCDIDGTQTQSVLYRKLSDHWPTKRFTQYTIHLTNVIWFFRLIHRIVWIVAHRCVFVNYTVYLFSMKPRFFKFGIHCSTFRSKLSDDWWLHTAYVETCEQLHKISLNRLWRHERGWIFCVVIN